MGKRKDRDNRPKPVAHVTLSSEHKTLRVVLLCICIVVALFCFGYGLFSALTEESGWRTVEVTTSELHCGGEFQFRYCLGISGMNATAEYKQVAALYSKAVADAYRIFSQELPQLGTRFHETVSVDPALYEALRIVQASRNRCLYLAPVYVEYARLFITENEAEAKRYDPAQNPEQAEYILELASYANDPQMVNLELLDDHQVRLHVSEAYLSFLTSNGITCLLDFGWMKNAFIADYLAGVLEQGGFTAGYLASYDGFTRNLDQSGQLYTQNIFDRNGSNIYLPARLEYAGNASLVYLRNYPMTSQDSANYYPFSSGTIVTSMLDPEDGRSKSATDNILAYSESVGCSQILLQLIPVYISDSWDGEQLNALKEQGIYSIWFEDTKLLYNDAEADIHMLTVENMSYSKRLSGA